MRFVFPLFSFWALCFFALGPQSLLATSASAIEPEPIETKTQKMEKSDGFFPYYWDASAGKIWLEVERFEQEFLYVNSLVAGVGSNDIGLDRGQLGNTRIVRFERSGAKVLLIQSNYDYRAVSDNADERKSVKEAFAESVLGAFQVEAASGNRVLIDVTAFMTRDAHGIVRRLKDSEQGSYEWNEDRSAVYRPNTRNFPKNTELEATVTYLGDAKGNYVEEVVPSPDIISVRQRHSFIELPDDGYSPRPFDPRSGYFALQFKDYASQIEEPLVKRYIHRHRLKKKDPNAKVSEAVAPIVYYLDRGAPEPIRSALLDGARWWNQAFEAAGYKGAFRVELLPEGADPMDIRYNVIQWVHRSTRGWSYGSSVSDPRTGEILKGHVSLGSLRVRQDYLIAQGLLKYSESEQMKQMALARLRQLSAHEVGHTLGLAHNFAASVNGRSSVMDYPHPYIQLGQDGQFDFSQAYDDKIGEWDKRAILYGYQDFPKGVEEKSGLDAIIKENIRLGLHYLSDRDARPQGGAHPLAHLWDNGSDAIAELDRLLSIRQKGLQQFDAGNLAPDQPLAQLEEVLVPLYLMHRYQLEAVVKLVGGVSYNYSVKGDGQPGPERVGASQQKKAIDALMASLRAEQLRIPDHILQLIPPKPQGYSRTRESFRSKTGSSLDAHTAAEALADHTLSLLLNPQRAARLIEQSALDGTQVSFSYLLDQLVESCYQKTPAPGMEGILDRMVGNRLVQQLMDLAVHSAATSETKSLVQYQLTEIMEWGLKEAQGQLDKINLAYYLHTAGQIKQFKEHSKNHQPKLAPPMPDGSPIGCH
ncbi:MAG: zinc-dependent metalloprotease [Bacteroidota bacterium]